MLTASLNRPVLQTTVCCQVSAWATLRADADMVARTRKQPLTLGGEARPPSFLKQAEAQTVLALHTIQLALEQHGWQDRCFADWGVIAAASLFGRIGLAETLCRMKQEGAWGVTPHLIPHQSLHGMSGTISQALKIHGPNFGVSGAPYPWADAFLLAAALMTDGMLPGMWLVLTGHETEWLPAADGQPTAPPVCHAAVLALTPVNGISSGLQLSIGVLPGDIDAALAHLPEFDLASLADDLTGPHSGVWRLSESHGVGMAVGGTL